MTIKSDQGLKSISTSAIFLQMLLTFLYAACKIMGYIKKKIKVKKN